MRNILFGLTLAILAGCVSGKQAAEPEGPVINPITGSDIAQTTLPSAPAAASAAATAGKPAAPNPAVATPPAPESAKAEPAAQTTADVVSAAMISPEEIACVKARGTWGTAGRSGGRTCIYSTKDGGKSCGKEDDCEGVCLARSKTCSPVRPLFGCNDILQNDGVMATLCID